LQGRGQGRLILEAVERRIKSRGGKKLYADTSSTERYAPTRAFYERNGFIRVAMLEDFYRAGDGKVIYEKRLD
jgi:ribosomal protein S18 acetylase RimI-like enzyme